MDNVYVVTETTVTGGVIYCSVFETEGDALKKAVQALKVLFYLYEEDCESNPNDAYDVAVKENVLALIKCGEIRKALYQHNKYAQKEKSKDFSLVIVSPAKMNHRTENNKTTTEARVCVKSCIDANTSIITK